LLMFFAFFCFWRLQALGLEESGSRFPTPTSKLAGDPGFREMTH
jgi:hypothetical protein